MTEFEVQVTKSFVYADTVIFVDADNEEQAKKKASEIAPYHDNWNIYEDNEDTVSYEVSI